MKELMRKIISSLIVCLMVATSFVGFSSSLSSAINPQKTLVHGQNDTVITSDKTHDPVPLPVNSSWWDANWTYSREITIDHTKVAGDLINFPVLVKTTLNISKVQTDGDDIVFTNSQGMKLSHEIELYNGSSGELVVWVNITSLSSTTDTTLWMYYDNPMCSNQQNKYGTWDSDYIAILHMNGTSSTAITDSTAYKNNVTGVVGNPTYQQTGKAGYSVQFPGTAYLTFSSPVRNNPPIAVEAWAKPTTFNQGNYFLSNGAESNGNGFTMDFDGGSGANYMAMTNASNSRTVHIQQESSSTGTWYYYGMSWSGAFNDNGIFCVQSSKTTVAPTSYVSIGNYNLCIGVNGAGATSSYWPFTGYVDEIRISKIARTDAWLLTSYNSINSSSTFVSIGEEHLQPSFWWNTNWSYDRILPIFNPSNLYQMKIVIGESQDGDVNCNGHCKNDFSDIRFVDIDNSTELPYWIENFTAGDQATFWVKLPNNVQTDGAIVLYYGNPSAVSLSNGEATFLTFINNTDGWTGDTQILSMDGGRIRIYSGPGPIVYHTITTGGNYDISVDAKIEEIQDPYINYLGVTVSDGTANYNDFSSLSSASDWNNYQYVSNNGNGYVLYSPWAAEKNREWMEVVRTSVAKVDYYLYEENGSLLASAINQNYTWSTATTITHVRLGASIYRDINAYISWIRVRKYASPEPLWGTPGEEQPLPTPDMVYVDDDFNSSTLGWGYDHFNHIQDGIDAVAENGTVFVYNGFYYENVLINRSHLTLKGEEKNTTIIDALRLGNSLIIQNTDHIIINGFTIRNASENGILLYGLSSDHSWINHDFNLSNLIIRNNSANGIYIHATGYGCRISNTQINNCEIFSNGNSGISIHADGNHCIIGESPSRTNISNCQIRNNSIGVSLRTENHHSYVSAVIIQNCSIEKNNDYGIETSMSGDCWNDGNIIYHNNFVNNTVNAYDPYANIWQNNELHQGNYWSDYSGSDNNFDGIGDTPYNIPGGSNKDLYPLMQPWAGSLPPAPIPTVVYVDDNYNTSTPGWEYNHFSNIQKGVDAVEVGGTVFVYNGTYTEEIQPNLEYVRIDKSLSLKGENKESTIINCPEGETGVMISITWSGVDNVNISGFTVQGEHQESVGIYANPYCNNLRIEDCIVHSFSEGISCRIGCSNITISNCVCYDNNRDGGISFAETDYKNIVISDCVVHNNSGGIGANNIVNCIIKNITSYNNYPGYGICLGTSENGTISYCKCYNNNDDGIRINSCQNSRIINCSVYNNSDDGIDLSWGPCTNNIISGNNCSNNRHGIILYQANNNYIYQNNILSNRGYGIYPWDSSSNLIYHNNLNNTNNAYDANTNYWYNNSLQEGNYWSDYTGEDNNHDGIGDTPYNISGGSNQDLYPLMNPNGWMISNITLRASDPLDTTPSFGWINVTSEVTDDLIVSAVRLNITSPDGSTTNISMNALDEQKYYYNITFTQYGIYQYFIWASDAWGNACQSSRYEFVMPPNWEIKIDGVCDLLDLITQSNHYEETGPYGWIREDVNNDGWINILDLVIVSNHYEEQWLQDNTTTCLRNPSNKTIISIDPPMQTVSTGKNFTVTVNVTQEQPIKGLRLRLSFNASLIHANSITQGDLFEGFNTYFNPGTFNNTRGEISSVYDLIVGQGNVTTPGTFITISFTADSSVGTSYLNLYNVGAGNETSYVPITVYNGSVDIVSYQNAPPVANFTYAINDDMVVCNASLSSDIDGNIILFSWDFGDGTNATGIMVNHTYSQYGTYYVTLTVIDDDGSQNSLTLPISILDIIPPEIIDNTPSLGYTGDVFTFNATITDNDDIDVAFVYFWYDNGNVSVAPLSNRNGDFWVVSIYIENTLDSLNYYFATNDVSGNFNSTVPKSITIIDNDNPTFIDNSPLTGTTGDPYTFDVTATDNIGVANVTVTWTHGQHSGTNVPLNNDSDGTWSLSITLDNNLNAMIYNITVTDTSNNEITGPQMTVQVTDNDKPVIVDHTPSVAHAGDPFTFNVTVTDNNFVSGVWVEYWFDDNAHVNATMTNVGGTQWEKTIAVNLTSVTLRYIISAIDGSGNWQHTGTNVVPIGPDYPPETPQRPTGSASGKIHIQYTYNTTTTDPNNDQVYYKWSWGDGNISDWLGPFTSGELASAQHIWNTRGSYEIKVKAKDEHGLESDWSDPLPITMPMDLVSNNSLLINQLNQSPNAYPLLKQLLTR